MRVSSFLIVGLLVCIVLFLFLGHFCFVLCCVCGCLKHPPLLHFEAAQFYTCISLYIYSLNYFWQIIRMHYFFLSFFFWITFYLYVIYCYCTTLTLCFGWCAGLRDCLHRRRTNLLRASSCGFLGLSPTCNPLVGRRSILAIAAGVTLDCEWGERPGSLQEPSRRHTSWMNYRDKSSFLIFSSRKCQDYSSVIA